MSHAIRDYPDPRDSISEGGSTRAGVRRITRHWAESVRPEWAIALGATFVLIPIIVGCIRTIVLPQPQNPWESGSVAEAWRTLHGLPVYEWPRIGHATLMYGPLGPWLLGAAFRITGPAVWTGRALQFLSALVLVVLFVAICMRSRPYPRLLGVAAAALFLGVDTPSGHYFVQNRPDMTAFMLGGVGLATLWVGVERRRNLVFAAGVACLLLGMLFKQTVMMLCVVPALPILHDTRSSLTKRLILAATPLMAAVALIVTVKIAFPVVYHYMVTVPKQYRISPSGIVNGTWLLVSAIPLFPVCAVLWLAQADRRVDKVLLWVLSALVITVPASILTYAKDGGAPNSLVPGLFAMAFFTALYLPALLDTLRNSSQRLSGRLAFAGAVGSLLALEGLLGVLTAGRKASYDDYRQVVKDVARLAPKRVVAPEDPLIPLAALGTLGRNVYLEYDAWHWPRTIPDYMQAEIRAADYVVDVREWWQNIITERSLPPLGFVKIVQYPHYAIWQRR